MKKIFFLTMMVIIATMFLSNYAVAENVPIGYSV